MSQKLTRRQFVRRAGLTGFAFITPYALGPAGHLFAAVKPGNAVFDLGVASGDPTPSGVILWTRVNPSAYDSTQALGFQVAADPAFTQIVTQGTVDPADFGPDRDYTVKLDLDGVLEAGATYYYRFGYQGVASRIGRCRTLPAANSAPASITFGVLTCQRFNAGYYGALSYLAQDDVDFVIHLGDFIYETRAADPAFPGREVILPSGNRVALSLEDYRYLYRRYRSDRFLRRLLASHTIINVWDDHEMANNAHWDYAADAPDAPLHPFSGNPDAMRQLKMQSMRAWAEYVPARLAINTDTNDPHEFYRSYRQFKFGDLLELFMVDGRTYRTEPPPPGNTDGSDGTMLGDPQRIGADNQRDWMVRGIVQAHQAGTRWKVVGNQTLYSKLVIPTPGNTPELFDRPPSPNDIVINTDSWDGYPVERQRISDAMDNFGVRNWVVLSGDLHAYVVSRIEANWDGFFSPRRVGVEFMTPSVTSENGADVLPEELRDVAEDVAETFVRLLNPHIKMFNAFRFGYSTVRFTAESCTYTAWEVDKTIDSEAAPRTLLKVFKVDDGSTNPIDITP